MIHIKMSETEKIEKWLDRMDEDIREAFDSISDDDIKAVNKDIIERKNGESD